MKKLLIVMILVLFTTTPALADYTIELKNESDVVIKTYTVTTDQVTHLQKVATRNGTTVIVLLENTIKNLILSAKINNMSEWRKDNEAYIEEQSRQ